MSTVKELSCTADEIAVPLEELGQKHGVIEDGVTCERVFIDVVA